MSCEVTITSLNCQGLNNFQKRRDVFNYLRDKNSSIVCLQDTHFTKEMENRVRAEWGYEVVFNSFSSQSRGVAILFNNNFQFTLHNTHIDRTGNLIILDIEIEQRRITLVNLYGPNKDTPDFYDNIKKLIIKQGNVDVISVGDWNLLLNQEKDAKNYKHANNPKSRLKVLEIMNELNLYDIWREENTDTFQFTWKRRFQNRVI